jgi:predicted MFS family arabinose efflux permease
MQNHEPQGLPLRTLLTILFSRTVALMTVRVVYPFLPAIARGMGVSLEASGRMVALYGGIGLLAPLFGHLSDRHGRRRIMELSLVLIAFASGAVALTGQYYPVLFAFAVMGLAHALFVPAVQAYVGDLVPYARRGRAFALISMAWSLSWLIGVPLSGLLIQGIAWQAPWALFSLLAVVGLFGVRAYLPPAERKQKQEKQEALVGWRELLRRGNLRAALVVGFGIPFAIENVFIVYGAFLENRFALTVGAIGLVSIIIGVSELLAEGGAVAWTDRIGKRRSVIGGLFIYGATLILLPAFGATLLTSLFGFALAIFFFEFTIVSFFPLMSELAPDARATLLSLNVAVMGLGRMVAPVVGTTLYARTGDIMVNSLLSAVVCLLCAAIMWRGVQEQDTQAARLAERTG